MNLETTYLGLRLKHPIVPSASPLSETLDGIRKLEDTGAAAIVLFSLFEEQIEAHGERLHRHLTDGADSYGEALSYLPDLGEYRIGPDAYFELIRKARAHTDIPIIGSLNAYSSTRWAEYAGYMEEAGSHAIELNVYHLPTDPLVDGAAVEQRYLDLIRAVRARIAIPFAVKLSPYFSSLAHIAGQ
ncbi:MAG: dihydroorotate dehydrogenase-like protein, partial [candidate division Zixibacteria bacterium]|nr:dihydroorotate dehydrogenase-like protein [candidate division Zixibacteria bacterium]